MHLNRGPAQWLITRRWLVTSDTHYTARPDEKKKEKKKATRTLSYKRCKTMQCSKKYHKRVCHFVTSCSGDCDALCSPAIWVSVWEMSPWQRIKAKRGSAIEMSETVRPQLQYQSRSPLSASSGRVETWAAAAAVMRMVSWLCSLTAAGI